MVRRSPSIHSITPARAVLTNGYQELARGLAPWLASFEPDALVIGGSIARSWALIDELLVPQLVAEHPDLDVRPAWLGDDAPMLGAAHWLRAAADPGDG